MGEKVLIWLCSTDKHEIEQIIVENEIEKVVDDIRIFDDVDQCIDNLTSIDEERIFFRLGHGFSYLLDILNDCNQIYYIYPSEPAEYKNRWQIRQVFNSDVQFFHQLKKDLNYWENHYAYLTFSDVYSRRMERTVSIDIQHHAPRFMWSQLLLETLLKMPSSMYCEKDFLDEARRLYRNNLSTLSTTVKPLYVGTSR